MKKIILILLINIGVFNYAQVIIGSQVNEDGTFLKKEDLEVNKTGNSERALKIEYIEPLCDKSSTENEIENCPPYSQTYVDTQNNNQLVRGAVPKIFQKLVFYIKVGNKNDDITEFDTKIDANKYNAILVGADLLLSEAEKEPKGAPFPIKDITTGLRAVKDVDLIQKTDGQGNITWMINAGYSSTITDKKNPIWRIQLLLMDRSFVSDRLTAEGAENIYDLTQSTIDRTYPKILEGKNVGVGETDPKANLDVKGHFYLKNVTDVTTYGKQKENLKNTTIPIVADISKENGEKSNKWGLLKSGDGEKIAYPIQLNIGMGDNAEQMDFLYYLTLGLNPNKYTPILGNAQLTCNNSSGYSIKPSLSGYQATLNTYLELSKNLTGETTYGLSSKNDWVLYLDYSGGIIEGCSAGNAVWKVFLLVFKNRDLINIPVMNNGNPTSVDNPIDISADTNYNESTKGYTGSVEASPLP